MSRPKSVEEALEVYYKKREAIVVVPPAMTAELIFYHQEYPSSDGKPWAITVLPAP